MLKCSIIKQKLRFVSAKIWRRKDINRIYRFILFSLDCSSRLEFNFLLLCVFVTPSKSTMHKSVAEATCLFYRRTPMWKNIQSKYSAGPQVIWRCIFNFPSKYHARFSCWCVYLRNISSVSVWSHRETDMGKVSVRKWKINQYCLLESWF